MATSISHCVTLKLTEKNYHLWKTQFESFLSSHLLLGYVDGSEEQPPLKVTVQTGDTVTETSNPAYHTWFRFDQMVRAWLLGSLSEDILGKVYHLNTSYSVWTALSQYFNKVSISRLFQLWRKLRTISKQNKSMAEYLKEYKGICDTLSSFGHPKDEQSKIFGVLYGLGKDYEAIIRVIVSSLDHTPSPTYEDVVSQLTVFDDRLIAFDNSLNNVTPHVAFSVNGGGRGSYSPRFGSNRSRGDYSIRGRGFHQQAYSSSDQRSNRLICQICGRTGHGALKCFKRFDITYQSDDVPSTSSAVKLLDLQESSAYQGNESVMVGDGSFLPITHIGSVHLT